MTQKRETVLHENIIKWIRAHCPESEVQKRHGSPMMKKGDPDLTGCIQGYHVEIEVKKPGGKLSDKQVQRARVWIAAGAIYGVAETVSEAIDILKGSGKIQITE